MASKEMAYLNIGNDEFEIVDEAGRQATSAVDEKVDAVDEKVDAVDEKVDGLSASNLPYSSTQSTKQKIDGKADKAWNGAGSRNFDAGTGDWNLTADISNGSEVLLVIYSGDVVRASAVIPMDYIKANHGGIDYVFANYRNYIFFNYVSGTKLNVTASVNAQSTPLQLHLLYR